MKITARYASKCGACGGQIAAGDQVEWSQGQAARHLDCAQKPAAAPAAKAAPARPRAANSRCPNPRDCGDPTCDGGCGY